MLMLCEWCKRREAELTVNMPGNWLPFCICHPCYEKQREVDENRGGQRWFPICTTCGGDGRYDDVLPCPDCDGEGFEEDY